MILFKAIWYFIQIYFGIHLIFPVLLFLHAKLRGTDRLENKQPVDENNPDYGIIITAYQQLHQIPDVVASVLSSNYNNYMIYVVADNCDISELNIQNDKVLVLRPPTVLGANVRSHFYAIYNFVRAHSHIVIVDSDNIVDSNFLTVVNRYIKAGFNAVQGVRAAKNTNTVLARLDAARDIYYHYYDGKLLYTAGSSATLAGSGMAFSLKLFKDCLENRDVTGAGFDKVLQHAILSKNERIAFAEEAIVWDEKTAQSDQLVNQRARWINTWFRYFSKGFGLIWHGLVGFDLNKFLFGIVLIRPPLFILLIASFVLLVLNVFFVPVQGLLWFFGLLFFIFGFMLSLWLNHTDPKIYKALISIPSFIFYQLKSLLLVRKANKVSVATKHSTQEDRK